MNSTQLLNLLSNLFPNAMNVKDFTIAVDSSGNATIATWLVSGVTEPTAAQLSTALASLLLSQAQTAQTNVIYAAYQTARYGTPVSSTVGGVSVSFPTDSDTQGNIMAYIAANVLQQTAATVYPLLDATGALQQLTYTELVSLAQAIQAASLAAFGEKQTLTAQIASASSVSSVQSIVWS